MLRGSGIFSVAPNLIYFCLTKAMFVQRMDPFKRNVFYFLLKCTNHKKKYFSFSVDKQMAENLAQDMADLMADFDLVSR